MGFQLSDAVDRSKVFLVRRSEVEEERFDPYYYKFEFTEIVNKLKNIPSINLKLLNVDIRKGVFDMSPSNYKNTGVPFIRVSNIKDGTINFDNIVYITAETHQNEIKTEYCPDDLVISKVGTIGEIAILPNTYPRYNISQNVVGLKINNDVRKIIKPKYFQVFLRSSIGFNQFCRQFTSGVQPKITLHAIRKIIVPIPSIAVQNKIINKINIANSAKKEKEAEAQRLLDSIDDYLLKELGIALTEEEENTIQKRMFVRKFSEVSGGRFDAYFYKPYYYQLLKSIRRIESFPLSDVAKISNEIWDQKSLFDEYFPYIEIGEIDTSLGEINNIKSIDVNKAPSRARMIVRSGDILISTTRPTRGAITIFNGKSISVASTGFFIIRDIKKNIIDKYYLFHVLRASCCLAQMGQRSSGGNYPAITTEELKKILIPIVPLPMQQKIANHIYAIRTQAKQLRTQAAADLKQAKKQVEKMILGDTE